MQAAKEARVRGGSGEGADAVDSWKRPPAGWLKVNTDGARNSSTEVDSADAVNAVKKRRNGFARIPILTQVLALLDEEWDVQVCRVPRRVNRVADGLAKIASFDSLECITFEAPPDAIAALLQLDALEA
ncbi:hypothetical protein V6N11_047282 [Hibiscus sabdariffa]|uniref:RNase H type-1 domain-containing protein n=2 Tax=Hibiscus sabdariffa TaxID=183260 RepID=A0ABR2BEB7_9ROSI